MSISLVAHAIAGGSGGGDATTTAIDTSAATLIVAVACGLPIGSALGISSSPSTGFIALTKITDISGLGIRLFYFPNPTVSNSQTFSLTSAAWTVPALAVMAFSGADTVAPFDQENGADTPSATTSYQPGSITPSEDNEVIVTAITSSGGVTSYSIDSGFTISDQFDLVGGDHFSLGMAYLRQTSAAASNPTWSWSNSLASVLPIASFKVAASAGTTQPGYQSPFGWR